MNILIIGGTRFVGRAIAESALNRGHNVTLFHRGKTGGELFTQAEHIFGDREHDLALLEGRSWDIVIDTCAYTPRITRLAAEALSNAAPRYLFISTISVYANFNGRITEESPLATLADPTVEEINGETYGGLKVLCESVVSEIYGSRATILRPGLIAGPHDPTDRFTYWVDRIARGGETLAPRISERPIEFIDARDLADFTVTACEDNVTGVYNAVGFDPPLSIENFLTACCAELSGHC
ncbi:MAG TPA: NAD-dependent epimerase/dehydratase family protein, partial [candidate division Zixibacteria bacterium]|nr:NAD-dependent epimerase/dehydratase family protein [candidate division Zixibacteria bacterium]